MRWRPLVCRTPRARWGYRGGFLSAEQRCCGPLTDSLNGSRLTNKALMAVAGQTARLSPSRGLCFPQGRALGMKDSFVCISNVLAALLKTVVSEKPRV